MQVQYLTGEEILVIHYTLMELYGEGEQNGIKFQAKFESMLERPKGIYFGTELYPTVIDKACCYYHSIARGHIFHNGNKRTALAVFFTFLDINGYELQMPAQEAEDYTVRLANDDKYRGNDCIQRMVEELEPYIIPKEE
ncbi:death-on-curing protein [Anoxybacillus tepidamans]|uniref:Death-on-curing protein n=1 Tax=Anoxybacteroides tepidamans TaxID=265948 RepID=A0A7W8IN00_9BACL|nr:type II toxin-antitoxin system death-on-curing family toxin [Anoxybacillus tepidamans]MBB5323492.1 death-on-curing protein [Anoxybacillus tepidamans]